MTYPSNAGVVFAELINICNFDFLAVLEEFDINVMFDVSDTMPFNDNFNSVGYDSRNTVALFGTINIAVFLIVVKAVWFFMSKPRCFGRIRCCKKVLSTSNDKEIFQLVLLFALETFLELLICTIIVFAKSDEKRLFDFKIDKWIYGDYLTLMFCIGLMVWTAGFLIMLMRFTLSVAP